jgi:hypothetical protein
MLMENDDTEIIELLELEYILQEVWKKGEMCKI